MPSQPSARPSGSSSKSSKMANVVSTKSARGSVSRADAQKMVEDAVALALASRSRRKSAAPAVDAKPETEADHIRRMLRMQNGFRGRILLYLLNSGPGTYKGTDLLSEKELATIDATNMSACLVHIAWKMQLIDCGYSLAVDGRKENVVARLSRTTPVVKAPRKARKAKVAQDASVVSESQGEVA